jgi:hypothetical protein
VIDAASHLRTATRRAKSDVANKLISMFLHELSQSISKKWQIKIGSDAYIEIVRESFGNLCPYCSSELTQTSFVIEHLDGMNRLRAGLHVPGNVLVACKRCNNEKRRDDSLRALTLATSGWESFLSHDGSRCSLPCGTCKYWASLWPDLKVRKQSLGDNLQRIRIFRSKFAEFQEALPALQANLPTLLARLYSECQSFAETEIETLLQKFQQTPGIEF